jgi:hypothetical protein
MVCPGILLQNTGDVQSCTNLLHLLVKILYGERFQQGLFQLEGY